MVRKRAGTIPQLPCCTTSISRTRAAALINARSSCKLTLTMSRMASLATLPRPRGKPCAFEGSVVVTPQTMIALNHRPGKQSENPGVAWAPYPTPISVCFTRSSLAMRSGSIMLSTAACIWPWFSERRLACRQSSATRQRSTRPLLAHCVCIRASCSTIDSAFLYRSFHHQGADQAVWTSREPPCRLGDVNALTSLAAVRGDGTTTAALDQS